MSNYTRQNIWSHYLKSQWLQVCVRFHLVKHTIRTQINQCWFYFLSSSFQKLLLGFLFLLSEEKQWSHLDEYARKSLFPVRPSETIIPSSYSNLGKKAEQTYWERHCSTAMHTVWFQKTSIWIEKEKYLNFIKYQALGI